MDSEKDWRIKDSFGLVSIMNLRLSWCGVSSEWDVEGNSVVGALHGGLVSVVYIRTATAEVTSHRFEHDEADDGKGATNDSQ